VDKNLPPRPDLDHLRRQAKGLLSALEAGDPEAVSTILHHLPAARGMNSEQVRRAGFRLADAQSAVARRTGFASWPQLARHVDQLRALEGTWEFASLEIEGQTVPPAGLVASRLLIDGDRFRTESPEATYEGVFNIDVESVPHGIDIEFVAGPEAGNWNYGIFRLEGDRLEICLDMTGKGRPAEFRTLPGTGHALESLRRASRARPGSVTGGAAPVGQRSGAEFGDIGTACAAPPMPASAQGAAVASEDPCGRFEYVPSATLARLQGEWSAEKLVVDGREVPSVVRATGRRLAKDNEIRISVGGRVIIHALVRMDESADPVRIDYSHVATGAIQHGIMQWRGESACFCMSAPGQPRPDDFSSAPGSGRTLSQWRQKK